MKILKILAGIVITLVVLVVIAISLFVVLFNPNDFKPQIAQAVKDATQRELVMAGDIEWRFFPWLGVSLNDVTLSNPPDFPAADTTFTHIETAQVEVKLLSLLQTQPEVGTLVLHDARLNLIRTAEGHTNWEDLMPAATDQPTDEPVPEPSGGIALPNIQGIDFRNATVIWDDQMLAQQFTLSDVSLTTGALALNAPIEMQAQAGLASNLFPDSKGHVSLTTTTTLNPAAQLFEFQPLQVTVTTEGAAIPEGEQVIKLDTAIAVNLATQNLEVGRVLINAFETALTGDIKVTGLQSNPVLTGNLRLDETNLRQILEKLGQAPNTTDPTVLQTLRFNSTFAATLNSLRVEPLSLTLDQTEVNGVLNIRDFMTAATDIDLQVNTIDLDRYLPPVSTQPPSPPQPAEPPTESPQPTESEVPPAPTELPLEMLKALDLNGTILVNALKVSNFRINDATLVVSAKDGQLSITPQASFYQGGYQGVIELDANPQPPVFRLQNNLQDVQIGAMLTDVMGADALVGLARFTTDLNADATSLESLQTSLSGTVDFGIEDGALKGFNIGRALREARALFGGEDLPPETTTAQTDFHSMGGTILAEQGVLKTDNLGIKAPGFRAEGNGSLTLLDKSLDFLLRAGLVSTSKGQEGGHLDELYGVIVPLKITGNVTAPQITPTLEGAITERTREKIGEIVEEKASELLEDHKDTLEEVGNVLKNLPSLFGGASDE